MKFTTSNFHFNIITSFGDVGAYPNDRHENLDEPVHLRSLDRLLAYRPGLQIRVCVVKLFSLFHIQNICCGYSKEPSERDGSSEHPKHMFKLMGRKIITILS